MTRARPVAMTGAAGGTGDLAWSPSPAAASDLERPLLDRRHLAGDREQRLLVPREVGLRRLPGVDPFEVDRRRRDAAARNSSNVRK